MEYDHERCIEKHANLEQLVLLQMSAMTKEITAVREMVSGVLTQVTATNGRVSSLEKWKYGFMCAVATLAAVKWPELKALIGGI